MELFLRILLLLVYILWLPIMLIARLFGRDALRLKDPGGASYWIARDPATRRDSYFSEASDHEGKGAGSPVMAAVLEAIAKLFAPPKVKSGERPIASAADREHGVPDEIYTLW
jgi:hypothetical protein